MNGSGWLVVGGVALFWIAMLGLLWRRSLVGMLIGLVFGWVSVALAILGFVGLQAEGGAVTGAAVAVTVAEVVEARALGSALVVCVVLLGGLQVAVGLAIVVARIERRGTLDADDAGLLEG
jgi:NADH:ubiquinone oxidoreductase subunit K